MIIANGSTDVTQYFVLRDSTTHAPKTDVTITDIDLYYLEQGAAISAKVDATALDAADSAHADNKAFHCGQGMYRIDWPDAAFDGGIGKRVFLIVVCNGVDTSYLEIELSPASNATSIAANAITATAIADDAITAAKLNTGAITADAFAANAITNAAVADDVDVNVKTITAGAINSAAIAASALNGKGDWSTHSAASVITAMGTGTFLSAIPWNAAWDAEVESECADAVAGLPAATKTAMESAGGHLALILEDTNEVQTELADGGRTDLLIDGIAAKTINIPASPAAVGSAMTVSDKTGFVLAATGLDAITATEPTGKPTTFPGWIMWLVQRFRRSSKSTTQILVKTEAGATVTTQAITDDGAGAETLGPPA